MLMSIVIFVIRDLMTQKYTKWVPVTVSFGGKCELFVREKRKTSFSRLWLKLQELVIRRYVNEWESEDFRRWSGGWISSSYFLVDSSYKLLQRSVEKFRNGNMKDGEEVSFRIVEFVDGLKFLLDFWITNKTCTLV